MGGWAFILTSTLCLQSEALHLPSAPAAISFYKSPQSPFPSGQAARSVLEKNQIREDSEKSFEVDWDRQKYEIAESDVLLEKKFPSNQAAFLFVDTFLREKKSSDGRVLTTIPQKSFLTQVQFEGDWLRVQWDKLTGYIPLNEVFLKSDFALWAYHKKLGWLRVSHRENAQMRTADQLLFPVEEFSSFVPDPHRALSLKSFDRGPQIRSRLQIKNLNSQKWILSQVEGHGQVWWKNTSEEKKPALASSVIRAEDLLQKDLFSMAFMNSKKMKGLVSARGIYRTENGQTWEKIEQFGSDDLPVAIHPQGIWYFGSFPSYNEGKTFEPLIRWDLVTATITEQLNRPPLHLRILKIEALNNKNVKVLFETGVKRIALETPVDFQDWAVAK